MRKEFLQLPAQAVMAELHNVQPLGKVRVYKISKKYILTQHYSHYGILWNFSKLLIERCLFYFTLLQYFAAPFLYPLKTGFQGVEKWNCKILDSIEIKGNMGTATNKH